MYQNLKSVPGGYSAKYIFKQTKHSTLRLLCTTFLRVSVSVPVIFDGDALERPLHLFGIQPNTTYINDRVRSLELPLYTVDV